MTTSFAPLVLVLVTGWLLAATIGAWAYFANEPNEQAK